MDKIRKFINQLRLNKAEKKIAIQMIEEVINIMHPFETSKQMALLNTLDEDVYHMSIEIAFVVYDKVGKPKGFERIYDKAIKEAAKSILESVHRDLRMDELKKLIMLELTSHKK